MRVIEKDEDCCQEMGARAAGDDPAEAVRTQNESMRWGGEKGGTDDPPH